MTSPEFLRAAFGRALAYGPYVAKGAPAQQENWRAAERRVVLLPAQRDLIASFTRRVHVLVLSGLWCGDCAAQCPMLAALAAANPTVVELRFVDRDEESELASVFTICGGRRVPAAIFMNEDFEFVSLMGDKTLTRLRALAARQLAAACPLPGAEIPADEAAATLQSWLDELERVHLLVRLSPRLRQRHGD